MLLMLEPAVGAAACAVGINAAPPAASAIEAAN